MVKHGVQSATTLHSHARTVVHHAHHASKKVARHGKRVAKFTHHHVAKRPHEHLRRTVRWYDSWHGKKYHGHTHAYILAVYLLVVTAVLANAYGRVLALSDLSNSWNFSTPGDYTTDAGIELTSNTARLKAQNYTSDAQTAALYHMDETNGTTLADSSANANNGTVANGTFGTGNLNNALTFNSTTSSVSVPDSASLSLTQKNSIEAWTKLNNPFSAGSSQQRQSIVDKGDYQLYYDNESGKIAYELADKNANSWTLAGGNDVNGGWDTNGKNSVNSQVKIGSNIYVALGTAIGDAEVWRWNSGTWTLIGGGPAAVNNSWDGNTYEGVYTLASDGTNLYAGLGVSAGDAEVWKFNGTSWSKIGGDALNGSWAGSTYEQVWTLDYFNSKLFVGLGNSAGDAEVWQLDGSTWSRIGGDAVNSSWANSAYEIVGMLTNDGTNLYAGLGTTAGDGEVWRWNGTSWTQIGGDSLNSGWDNTIETVRTLRYLGGNLYAGLGDTAGDADVWRWNGSVWTQIGGDGINSSWAAATYEQIGSFAWDGTNLYAGTGTSNGDGEVWRFNGTAWTKIGGDGAGSSWTTAQGDTVNTLMWDSGTLYAGVYDAAGDGLYYSYNGTTWTQLGGGSVNKSWDSYGLASVQVMQSQGGYLYAGTGNTAGTALVYRFNGTSWTLIGGQGVNSSWNSFTYEQVLSMASFNNKLYVGLGTSANDAEVWQWDGSTWTQVGGDSLNSSWGANYEEVDSLAVNGGYLYAGLGASAADGEVWRYNGTTWSKIGGDSINSGWTNYVERITSLSVYKGQLYAGLGSSAGDAEVWLWNSAASTWSKVGGDNTNSSWDTTTFEQVESMMPYNGKLYAGLGLSAGDAAVWEYDGTSWTKVGGDDVNNSWTSGTYEKVKTIVAYNGDLYAGLGNSAGDGEVWRYENGSWSKIAGNSVNSGWTNVVEEVEAFSPYKGKLYAGTGLTANADALVWSWGNNAYLESATSSFDTSWRHVAGTYDGSTMKLFVNGTQNASAATTVQLPDSNRPLLIGTTYGGREFGKAVGTFDGKLDELRISNDARSGFTAHPYVNGSQTVMASAAVRPSGVWHWDNFSTSETLNGGSITYRLSSNDGTDWLYWDGSHWTTSGSTSQSNDAATVSAHMGDFPVTFSGLKWQAVLTSNGDQQVTLNSVTTQATSDSTAPSQNASALVAKRVKDGANLTENSWTNGGSPYFSWTAGTDNESDIKGYCVYVGTDSSANPMTTKGLLGSSPVATGGNCQFIVPTAELDLATSGYLATALTTSNTPYYVRIKAIDNAGNLASTTAQFSFRFDNTAPTNPSFITAPSGFINNKAATLSWATTGDNGPSDANAGLAGLQYRIGNGGTWYGDDHAGTGDSGDLLTNDGGYTMQATPDFPNLSDGVNTVYFRAWDNAGNVTTTYVSAALKINANGAPSEPQNVHALPVSNTTNSFAFNWSAPATYVGDANNLTYCYTVNTLPSAGTCNYTIPGSTNLSAGPYATQPGENTFYIAAKDESGSINYASYAQVTFTSNTPSPGVPLGTDIVDVSIKSTNNWRLALTWESPSYTGAGVTNYKVYRSTDNTNFTFAGSSSSTTYIDANLTQQEYYYKVRACDSSNNCGAPGTVVHSTPTGKFIEPAVITAEPDTSDTTTRKTRISWSTDRGSDSKVALGTKSGHYSASEIGNSDQVSAHEIELDNLAAGTTYYYVAKWTDEDGNTGVSQEYQFTTAPAPSLKEVETMKVSLSGATVRFTSKDAVKVNVYYGKSDAYGGVQSINTSTSESTYSIDLSRLEDGSKYFYKLVTFDAEGNSYEGNSFSFTTPSRPRISNINFQPVAGEPTSTQQITWQTNVPSTSSVSYGRVGSSSVDAVSLEMVTDHTMIIRGLEDDSEYTLVAQSRDADGNLATSDTQRFRTALDTRPPVISNVTVEPSIRGVGAEARGQVVVSWHTDEPSSSQVAYAEGSNAKTFTSRSAEDTALTTEHIVIITDLPTSKVYSVQPISRDRAGNGGTGTVESAIIGRASDSVLTIILNTLKNIFGL